MTSAVTIFVLSLIFKLSHAEYVTMLPKSITTAIGMGMSEELGGYVTITVAAIILTGLIGNMLGEGLCKLFRINEPVAKGLAFGSSAHEIGEVEGAMSGLAIAVSGMLTVVVASVFAQFI